MNGAVSTVNWNQVIAQAAVIFGPGGGIVAILGFTGRLKGPNRVVEELKGLRQDVDDVRQDIAYLKGRSDVEIYRDQRANRV